MVRHTQEHDIIMRKIRLAAIVLAAACGTVSAGAANAATYVYKVTVKSNYGPRFQSCFTFDKGVLTVAGLGMLDYTAAPTDPSHYYTAVFSLKQAESLGINYAFAGFKTGNATVGKVHAVGADNHHDSYVIEGEAVAACPSSDSAGGASPWAPKAN